MTSKLYLGGIPTAPDVRVLRDAFASIEEGSTVTHDQIESTLGLLRTQSRYRTVVDAWRRELFSLENIEIAAVSGVGFRRLTPNERVEFGIKGFQRGTRKQGRSLRRLVVVPSQGLDAPHAARRDHAQRLGAAIYQQAVGLVRELEPPRAAQQITQQMPLPGDAA